jgi:hypothetical protein
MKLACSLLFIVLLLSAVEATPIMLYSVNVSIDNTWQTGVDNNITVFTYDVYNNLTNIESVFISSNDLNLNDTLMSNVGTGIYTYNFNLNNVTDNITFFISANDQLKNIKQNVTIQIEQQSAWANLLVGSNEFIDKFKNNLVVWLCSIVIVLLSVASLILLVEILRKKK